MTWRDAFAQQAEGCAALGSPLTATLLDLIATRGLPAGVVGDRIRSWPGDLSSRGSAVPLRLAGALHALVLEGRDPGLAVCYPPHPADQDALWPAVAAALSAHAPFILDRLALPPQTNEVRRSAVLIAAARWLTARHGLPVALSELGSSAGLNLLFDRFALVVQRRRFGPDDAVLSLDPDWEGPLPEPAETVVAERSGADLAPLDPVRDRLRLLSYLWPDQPDRIARTDAAVAEARRLRPSVACADAADWLAARLAQRRPGQLHLVFHTVAWQYFPRDTRDRIAMLLDEAGAQATAEAPLARFGMEAYDLKDGAALRLQLWPGNVILDLGRADFHGRWVRWAAPRAR